MQIYVFAAMAIIMYGIWRAFTVRKDIQAMSLRLSAALSLAISVLVFPYYRNDSDLPIALIQAFRAGISGIAMVVNGKIPYELDMSDHIFVIYRFLLYALYIAGPIAGSMFLFSFSQKLMSALSFIGKRHFHIFSSLNDSSIRIAETIDKNRTGGAIVFCSCKNPDPALANRARNIGAMMVEMDESDISLHKRKSYEFFEIDKDVQERTIAASRLCEKLLKDRNSDAQNVIVRVFADASQRELILNLDRQYAGKIFLRHIDEDSALAIEALSLCADELAIRKDTEVAVIADGSLGRAFVSNLLCLLIKPESKEKILWIGPGAGGEYERFLKEAPETGVYPIKAVSCAYGEEANAFEGERNPDAIFVLYKDGRKAYETATRMRRFLSSRSEDLSCAKIYCCIEDRNLHEIIREKDIVLFGNAEDSRSYDGLINPDIEKAARRVHLSYLKADIDSLDSEKEAKLIEETGFYQYQNQESSFGMALALKYKEKYILSFKNDETLSDREFIDKWLSDEENLKKMGDAEHDRWNAYQRVHGWRKADRSQTEAIIRKYEGRRANDPELRLHPAIVSNAELPAAEAMVNELLEQYGSEVRVNYLESDMDIVRKLTYILDR